MIKIGGKIAIRTMYSIWVAPWLDWYIKAMKLMTFDESQLSPFYIYTHFPIPISLIIVQHSMLHRTCSLFLYTHRTFLFVWNIRIIYNIKCSEYITNYIFVFRNIYITEEIRIKLGWMRINSITYNWFKTEKYYS